MPTISERRVPGSFLYTAGMISSARILVMPVLLFSLAGCGLKAPLYLPDAKQEEVATPDGGRTQTGVPVGTSPGKVRTPLPPAPQSQKKDRERLDPSRPATPAPPPVSPPDPDRPATTPPPPGP
jgi:predicted small lipoprotein YifL